MRTVKEWSDAFDVLFNNAMSNANAALDEYDKSIFLTKGEFEVVKNYFNPKGNKYQEGFDDSIKRQADFATLIKTKVLDPITNTNAFDSRSQSFIMPPEVFLVINEQIHDDVQPYQIIPISYDDYVNKMQKPYKYPPKNQVWRLITGETYVQGTGYWIKAGSVPVSGAYTDTVAQSLGGYSGIADAEAAGWKYFKDSDEGKASVLEIIGRFTGTPIYRMRYVKTPAPIVLVDLSTIDNTLSINGVTTETPCELPEGLHDEILQRAVELAKAAYATDQNGTVQLNNQVQIGQRSE
jgi:hypothetical protein